MRTCADTTSVCHRTNPLEFLSRLPMHATKLDRLLQYADRTPRLRFLRDCFLCTQDDMVASDLLNSPSPSKFGPGFGSKGSYTQLRFFSGRQDVRYQWGSNDHLKGRFGADLSTHMPDTFGPESDALCNAQRNRAAVASWLVPPDKPSHPGYAFAPTDYRRPETERLTLPEVEPRWARKLHLSTSARGLAPLMEERKYEDLSKEVTPEDLQLPRSERGVKLGPGFGLGPTPSRFPTIRDTSYGPVRRPVRRLKASRSESSINEP